VGLGAFFEPFSGSEFFRLPSRVSARPLAANARRWAAGIKRMNTRQGTMTKSVSQVVLRFIALIMSLFFTGCAFIPLSPTVLPSATIPSVTATPEKLQLVNGKLNACLLLTVSEVENVLTTRTSADPVSFDNGTGCRYAASSAESPVLVTFVYTDATFEEAGEKWTVTEWFEIEKQHNLEFATKISDITVEDVYDLGDAAYYEDSTILYLFILNNGIEYVFTTRTPEHEGNGSLQALIALAKISLPRMP
jgi:hypothetical protein